jgi:hypothetical protein
MLSTQPSLLRAHVPAADRGPRRRSGRHDAQGPNVVCGSASNRSSPPFAWGGTSALATASLPAREFSRDNRAMRGRWLVALTTMLLVSTVAACTSGAEPGQSGTHSSAVTPAAQTPDVLGTPGCHQASPRSVVSSHLPEVKGTGHGATLWGLLMFPHPPPARVGEQDKIVWRMTGTGALTLLAIDPHGTHHRLAWGPDPHLGSDWDRPGDEWGAGYLFDAPGCWDLHATRGNATADVWLRVVSR